jgi:pimeloyl-ACP methyl ester carboxylesterase
MIVAPADELDRMVRDRTGGSGDPDPGIQYLARVSPEPERLDVPVAGGTLAAYRWAGDGPVVLAAHGITSNHRSWGLVAAALDGAATLVAPDLRGRGRSNGLPGPYTIAQHADDCAAVLDHVGAADAVVAGHSMGGFVATALATRHPERVRAVVLVDGGPPLHVPPGVDIDDALAATLGPAMQRLDMTFADRSAYRAFWQQHPSFAGIWSDEVEAHVQHDLVGEEPELRSSCLKEAVRVNGRELLADEGVRNAVRDAGCPVVLLWAPRGMVDDPGGLYAQERIGGLDNELVPDTNHYSILLGAPGAKRIAGAIRRAL